MAAVRRVQAGAGVVLDARRAVLEVEDRRHEVCGLALVAGVPEALEVPRAGLAERGKLVTHAPAAVPALEHVDKSLLVTLVAVVVPGKEVAQLVEHEGLGVAEAGGEELEVGAVGPAAEDRALVRYGEDLALARADGGAAVAVAEVEAAVGAEDEAVQVVTGEVEPHAIAAAELGARLRAFRPAEFPQAGNVGEVNLTAAREHPGRDAVERGIETVRVDAAAVRHAIAVGIGEQADDFALEAQLAFPGFAEGAAD